MKKIIAAALALVLMIGTNGVTVMSETTDTVEVYVTISNDKGTLVLAQEKITVSDTDNDGAITVNDALYSAHEAKYEGGADAGYASSVSQYGMSLDKLWGIANGGSYGYYVNNISAWSLTDAIKNGDYIKAYAYTDLSSWSDTYCYFNVNTINAVEDTEVTLKLSMEGYDADWNPLVLPVEGATITLNGKTTEYKTDAEGNVTFKISDAGECIISAISETQTLVPPVCVANVEKAVEPESEKPSEDNTTESKENNDKNKNENYTDKNNNGNSDNDNNRNNDNNIDNENISPKTGYSNTWALVILVIISLSSIIAVSVERKDSYEK